MNSTLNHMMPAMTNTRKSGMVSPQGLVSDGGVEWRGRTMLPGLSAHRPTLARAYGRRLVLSIRGSTERGTESGAPGAV